MAEYITLANSDGSINVKYAVLVENFRHTIAKSSSSENTMSGGEDVTMGGVRHQWSMLVKVKDVPDTGYGSLDNLRTLYALNNPNATPSNVISFTDHYGTSHDVYMLGTFTEELLTAQIVGSNAVFIVPIMLKEKNT